VSGLLGFLLVCTTLGGCIFTYSPSAEDDSSQTEPSDAGVADGAETDGDGASPDACEPKTCEEIGCGTEVADGCGGRLDCGPCECQPGNAEQNCPPRPCQELVGCTEAGACDYQPVTCGESECTCAGDSCGPEAYRACGEQVCEGEVCDPAPTTNDAGETVYRNRCIDPSGEPCGTCGLGATSCSGETVTCRDPIADTSAGGDADEYVCEGSPEEASFLYVDPTYEGEQEPNGSREAPHTSLAAAISAANPETTVGVIIGGEATFEETIELESGISLYGGYSSYPDFRRQRDNRPTITAGTSRSREDIVFGMIARDIREPTVISGVDIRNPDLGDETNLSTVGLYAYRAPELRVSDVVVDANDAAPGADGEPGADATQPGTDGQTGEDARIFVGGTCTGTVAGGTGGRPGGTAGCRYTNINQYERGRGGDGGDGTTDAYSPNSGDDSQGGTPGGTSTDGDDGETPDGPDEATHGEHGSGATFEVADDGSIRLDGGDGADGDPGPPGYGGGGGASGTSITRDEEACVISAAGGGGGGGGCGGQGGRGGARGGWSVAVVAVESTGLEIRDSALVAGNGGDGGVGGLGGAGSNGGSGGAGGNDTFRFSDSAGNAGGDGGPGFPGGAGGSGVGGSSYPAWCDQDTTLEFGESVEVSRGEPGEGGEPQYGENGPPGGGEGRTFNCD
jgi:hypothetical protein